MYHNYIETMKQALAALEPYARQVVERGNAYETVKCDPKVDDAITALRLAIEQAERQESYWQEEARRYAGNADFWREKAKRQPLTEEEIDAIGSEWVGYPSYDDEFRWFAREIERKHGIGVEN